MTLAPDGLQILSHNGSSPLSNSPCAFDTDDITVSLVGTSLTLNLPISFSAGFGGAKTVDMMAITQADLQPAGCFAEAGRCVPT